MIIGLMKDRKSVRPVAPSLRRIVPADAQNEPSTRMAIIRGDMSCLGLAVPPPHKLMFHFDKSVVDRGWKPPNDGIA